MNVKRTETALGWIPTLEQCRVIDLLALGYSQNATSRQLGVPVSTIAGWLNEQSFSEQFKDAVHAKSELFQENLEAIEAQQQVLATGLIGRALDGEYGRDKSGRSIDLDTAIELLRPRWRYRAGERHKQFGT